jgi:fucose 4-O-acetylase-like acetyltransferase
MNWLDIAKGIAILAMVAGHVSLIAWDPFRRIIFSFHMPLFFVAAGFTSKPDFGISSIRKSAVRLLVPYLIVSFIVSLKYLLQGSTVITELSRILWGSGVPAQYGPGRPITGEQSIPTIGAIWFLPCLFFSRLLFSGLLRLARKWKTWLLAIMVAIISACGYLIGQFFKFPLGVDIALFSLVFFYAGYLFRKYDALRVKSVLLSVLLLVLWYLALKCNALELSARYYREFPACVFATIGAIAACFLIFYVSAKVLERVKGISTLLVYCGQNSMALLVIHYLDSKLLGVGWLIALMEPLSWRSSIKGVVVAFYEILLYLGVCFIYTTCKRLYRAQRLKRELVAPGKNIGEQNEE